MRKIETFRRMYSHIISSLVNSIIITSYEFVTFTCNHYYENVAVWNTIKIFTQTSCDQSATLSLVGMTTVHSLSVAYSKLVVYTGQFCCVRASRGRNNSPITCYQT